MFNNIIALTSLLGLTISIILLAWQTRAVAEQTRLSNSIAGASTLDDALCGLREILMLFVEHPELRAYFYDRRQCPTQEPERGVVITVGEMLADVLGSALHATKLVPATNSYDDWADYARHMLANSPALAHLIDTYPQWWPNVAAVRQ